MTDIMQDLAARERQLRGFPPLESPVEKLRAMGVSDHHPMEADLPPLPFWQRAVVIVALAAVLWAGVWIVARGIAWIWRAWQ